MSLEELNVCIKQGAKIAKGRENDAPLNTVNKTPSKGEGSSTSPTDSDDDEETPEEIASTSETTSNSVGRLSAQGEGRTVIRAKLPKRKIKHFNGRANGWQGFWDSSESSIDLNPSLLDIDKFSYLRGLLQGEAHTAIAGFSLTSANYAAALALLKRRFAKKTAIQQSHINDILNATPVYGERDTRGLMKL